MKRFVQHTQTFQNEDGSSPEPRPKREQKRVDTGLSPRKAKQREEVPTREIDLKEDEVKVSISPSRRVSQPSAQKKGFMVKPAEVNYFTGRALTASTSPTRNRNP